MIKNRISYLNLSTVIYFLLIIVSVWVIYLIVYGSGGIVKRRKIVNEISLLQNEISSLKNEKAKLNWEIKNLTNDSNYLAGLACENGYKGRKELIYKFLNKNNFNVNKLKKP